MSSDAIARLFKQQMRKNQPVIADHVNAELDQLLNTTNTKASRVIAEAIQAHWTFNKGINLAGTLPVQTVGGIHYNAGKDAFIGYTQAGETLITKAKGIVNIKDLGVKGDGVTNDTQAIIDAINTHRGGTLFFPKGVYNIHDTMIDINDIRLIGEGNPFWRPAPYAQEEFDALTALGEFGTVLNYCGSAPRTKTIPYITGGQGYGMVYNNPQADYTLDQTIEFLDLTNQNAVGTTPATLRPFNACMITDTSKNPPSIQDMAIVLNNPTPAEGTYGFGNYADESSLVWGADYDFHVVAVGTQKMHMDNVSCIGYPRLRSILHCAHSQSNITGFAEHGHYERCVFQGGTCIRGGDELPVIQFTNNSITIPWYKSHTFSPTGGNLRLNEDSNVNYTGLSFNGSALPLPTLTFTGVDSTSLLKRYDDGTPSGIIETTRNGGLANTRFIWCVHTSLDHTSKLNISNPLFGVNAQKPRAAIEMSGQPLRGVTFEYPTVQTQEPVMFLFGNCRQVTLNLSHFERKSYRTTLNGETTGARGALAIAGQSPTYPHQRGFLGTSALTINGVQGGDINVDFSGYNPLLNNLTYLPANTPTLYRGSGLFNPNQMVFDYQQLHRNGLETGFKPFYGGQVGFYSAKGAMRLVYDELTSRIEYGDADHFYQFGAKMKLPGTREFSLMTEEGLSLMRRLANTDYMTIAPERDTFTPEFLFLLTTPPNYTSQVGRYVTIGNMCYMSLDIEFSNGNTGDTSPCTIGVLPKTQAVPGSAIIHINRLNSTGLKVGLSNGVHGVIRDDFRHIQFVSNSGGIYEYSQLLNTAGRIQLAITYEIA
jgi:hypothetical protein